MDDYLSGCLWLGAAFLLGIADELYRGRRRRIEPPAIGPRESVGGVSSFVGSSEHGPASADGVGAGPLVAGSGRAVWDRESITAPGAIAPDRDAVRPLAVAREH